MDTSGSRRFPPAFRLRRRWEYGTVREKGRKRHSAHFVVLFQEKPCGPSRLGITASRKVGGAVTRNRVKRLVREFFRNNRWCLCLSGDLSIIAKRGAGDLDYRRVCEELSFLLQDRGSGTPCSENRSLP